MDEPIRRRVLETARYIVNEKCTVRQAAEKFGIGKSTVHSDIERKLAYYDADLYAQVREVLEFNLSVRHLRGGESTRLNFEKKKKAPSDI